MHRIFCTFTQSPDGLMFGPAIDTIVSGGTAIGATLAATTIAAGDSFTIKNAPLNSDVLLLALWTDNQVAGMVRLRSAKLHDNVDAIRARTEIGVLENLLPEGVPQRLYPQDTEIVELAGSAVAGDIETVVQQVYYADLPGQAARLITPDQLRQRMRNIVGVRLAITIGSTLGYNGAKALNNDVDLLKANTDYALMGMTTDAETAAICLRGPDTGNLRVAVPGEPGTKHICNTWFVRQSKAFGLPLIPVINSANKGGTLIDVAGDENGGTANVTLWLAELG